MLLGGPLDGMRQQIDPKDSMIRVLLPPPPLILRTAQGDSTVAQNEIEYLRVTRELKVDGVGFIIFSPKPAVRPYY